MAEQSSKDVEGCDLSRLRYLIAALCDDTIDAVEREELERTLLGNTAARQLFLDSMCIHAGLEWEESALARNWQRCCTANAGQGRVSLASYPGTRGPFKLPTNQRYKLALPRRQPSPGWPYSGRGMP